MSATPVQFDAESKLDDNFERHLIARILKLEHEIAELMPDANAEPVAWQVGRMRVALGKIAQICRDSVADVPLPRSDASAGLIEAAKWHAAKAREIDSLSNQTRPSNSAYYFHTTSAEYFRARAADRSVK